MLLSSWAVTAGRMNLCPGGSGTVIGLSIGRERRSAKLSGEPHSQPHGFVPGSARVLKIHDRAYKAEMDGIEMEEISTLLELLPAACGCDDVSPRRKPIDEPTEELPLHGEATYSERICPKSKQGQFPADAPEELQAAIPVALSSEP